MSRRKFNFSSKHKKQKVASRSVAPVKPAHQEPATFTESNEQQDPKALVRLRSELSQAVTKRENQILREKVQALTEENERLRNMLSSVTKQNGDVLVEALTEENERLRNMLSSVTKQNGDVLVDLRSTLHSVIATIDKKIYSDQDSMAANAHKQRSAAVLDPISNQPVMLSHTLSFRRRKDIVSIISTTSHESNGSQTSDDIAGDKYFKAVISCRSSAAYNASSESEDISATAAKPTEESQMKANPSATTGPQLAGEVNPLEEVGEEEKEEDHVQSTVTLVPVNPVKPAAMSDNAEGTSCISSVMPKCPLDCKRATMKKNSTKPIPSWYDSTESEGDHSSGKKIDQQLFRPSEDKAAAISSQREVQGRSSGVGQLRAECETELERKFREREEKRNRMLPSV